MKHFSCAILAAALLAATPALAATPVPGGSYDGRTSQGAMYDVQLRVSATGNQISRFVFNWRAGECGTASNGAQGRIRALVLPISAGRFAKSGVKREKIPASKNFAGGTQIERYRISGSFTGENRARGTIRVTAEIQNKAGAVIDTCRMKRAATFRADRVGVTDPGDPPDALEG